MPKPASLADIQLAFQAAVRGAATADSLVHVICEKPPLSVSERLKIYQEAYVARLTESLKDDFEQCREKMGAAKFDEALQTFMAVHPSKSRNLAEYSEGFPAFLGGIDSELHELATKEWLRILASQAADPTAALSAEDIQNGKPFRVRVHPAAYLRLIGSRAFLSYRTGEMVDVVELESWQIPLIERLAQGATLDEIGELGLDESGVRTIQDWMQAEILYCEAHES